MTQTTFDYAKATESKSVAVKRLCGAPRLIDNSEKATEAKPEAKEDTIMTHAELNKAIYKVISSRFKKDCAEAYKAVTAAGYTISKWHGNFEVKNEATRRSIWLSGDYNQFLHYGWYDCQKKRIEKINLFAFDYVNCLNTPVNSDWYEHVRWYGEQRPTREKYDCLKSARWNRDYDKRRLNDLQKQIAELQERLISAAQDVSKSEQKLKDVKRELGLIK